MTFSLTESLPAPVHVAFTITPLLINAFSETQTHAKSISIHHARTIQQLRVRGGDTASAYDDIISSFKDELRRMRQDLGREAKLELKAIRAELRQKLGKIFDHEHEHARGEITEDDDEEEREEQDEYEYVEEEVEIEVEVDDDANDLEIEGEIDDDDDDVERDVIEGETNDEPYAMEDNDLDIEEDAEEKDLDYEYTYIDKNRKGKMDKKEDFDEEHHTEDLSEEIQHQHQTKQGIIDDDIFEVQEDDDIPDVHHEHEESQEIKETIEEDAIEIGESEEMDGNEEMVDTAEESPQVTMKPKKEKVKKKKKKSTKSNQKKKRKSKKSSSVNADTEEESAMVADRMAQELALKTNRQSESSLGSIVRALIPSILVILLIVLSHFGFELLLKQISPNESS